MTRAQAATVAAGLINAGYIITVTAAGTVYTVTVPNTSTPVAASVVANFAANNGVTGQVYAAEFI